MDMHMTKLDMRCSDSLNSACLDERMIRTVDNNRFTLLSVMVYRYQDKDKETRLLRRFTLPNHLEQARLFMSIST
jgi:hypothetical protein